MEEMILDVRDLPMPIRKKFSVRAVRVVGKPNGEVGLQPLHFEEAWIWDELEEIRKVYQSNERLSVDNFLARMREDKELES